MKSHGWMAAFAILVLAACGGGSGGMDNPLQPPPGPALQADTIAVNDNFFGPVTVKIASGGTVTWTWNPSNTQQHNVRWAKVPDLAMPPQGPTQVTGAPFDVTLTMPGVYEYVCNLHTGMLGTIFVE